MNMVFVHLQRYVRDLLGYDEQLIKQGRVNFSIEDLDKAYIVIDSLAPATPMSVGDDFDGDAEKQDFTTLYKIPFTISFYADGAYSRAMEFVNKSRSQLSFDLQRVNGVSVHLASGLTDAAQITGQSTSERVDLDLMVHYTHKTTIDTLRIDEAQVTFINDV